MLCAKQKGRGSASGLSIPYVASRLKDPHDDGPQEHEDETDGDKL
jgi:hypothetical protein